MAKGYARHMHKIKTAVNKGRNIAYRYPGDRLISSLREIFLKVLDGKEPYPHQLKAVEKLVNGKSVILRAPCGSGKTEVAYVRMLLESTENNLPTRLIYSLPTRALVEDIAERIKKGIEKTGLSYTISPQHGANSKDPFFRSDIVVATIDQTIGAYCCTPLSLPVHLGNIPAGAAVSSFLCFDEAHIYDYKLGLQSMLILLERAAKIDLPFLIMSATLPESFIDWFVKNPIFSDKIEVVEGDESDIPKRRERHVVLQWRDKTVEAEDILDATKVYNKIIVVCNTVDRAQKIYGLIENKLKTQNFDIYLLHSRFLNSDRECIEKNMKKSIKDEKSKTVVVTTQVCEVGLDISCDLLMTELAPPDALVQRMGRCAREGGNGEVWVYDVNFYEPYNVTEMERTKRYILEHLNNTRVGWKEELNFVNDVLDELFKTIMNDENRRRRILLGLGDAAFKGNREGIEKNVRENFTANITIHDAPETLNYEKLTWMPWLNVDVRVLKKHFENAKYWEVNFEHDEYGKMSVHHKFRGSLYPHGFYIIHPDFAKYDKKIGLILGEKGSAFDYTEERRPKDKLLSKYEYAEERWIDHSEKCLYAYRKIIAKEERHSVRLLAKIMGFDRKKVEGLLALSVALHDLGKLNIKWQRSIGVQEDEMPLAHTPHRMMTPPHATISAKAIYPIFKSLISNAYFSLAFKFALAHHHHTRAEEIPAYKLGWENQYKKVIETLCRDYSINVDASMMKIQEDMPSKLEDRMFNVEALKPYTAYCIIARIIRLSDRESFNYGNLFKS